MWRGVQVIGWLIIFAAIPAGGFSAKREAEGPDPAGEIFAMFFGFFLWFVPLLLLGVALAIIGRKQAENAEHDAATR